jgi:hypothetical protein
MCSQLRLSSYLSAQVLQESIIDPYRLVGNTGKLSEGHRGRMEPLHPKTGRFAQCAIGGRDGEQVHLPRGLARCGELCETAQMDHGS